MNKGIVAGRGGSQWALLTALGCFEQIRSLYWWRVGVASESAYWLQVQFALESSVRIQVSFPEVFIHSFILKCLGLWARPPIWRLGVTLCR